MAVFGNFFKNDPLVKSFGGSRPRRKKRSSRRGKLTASERRIVNAVTRRVKPKRRRRY